DWPSYSLTAPFWITALPSMKIVPATVSFFVALFQESSPAAVWHVYEAAGVRSTTDGTLLLRRLSPVSKMGGVPLTAVHGNFGPGLAAAYQPSQRTVGASIVGGAFPEIVAKTLSLVPHGAAWVVLFQ